MSNEKEEIKISKFLSLILRHQPEKVGLVLDDNGWTGVAILIQKLKEAGVELDINRLKHIVATNPKKRFAFNDTLDKIRANQGHSVDVELGYSPKEPPEILYHGTAMQSVASIRETGIEKRDRQQVHLSADIETALKVAQRHGKPFIFEVLAGLMHADKYEFYLSENGVWLTDHVPVKYFRSATG
jgi:putative RNA 2'-phosphotransferase